MPEEDNHHGLVAGKVDVLAQGWRGVAHLGHGDDGLVGVRALMRSRHFGFLEWGLGSDASQYFDSGVLC